MRGRRRGRENEGLHLVAIAHSSAFILKSHLFVLPTRLSFGLASLWLSPSLSLSLSLFFYLSLFLKSYFSSSFSCRLYFCEVLSPLSLSLSLSVYLYPVLFFSPSLSVSLFRNPHYSLLSHSHHQSHHSPSDTTPSEIAPEAPKSRHGAISGVMSNRINPSCHEQQNWPHLS